MDKLSFREIPSFTRSSSYRVGIMWRYLETQMQHYFDPNNGAVLDMEPDFQRGHVWTREQQIAFVEYGLKGGMSGRDIYFNCPGWMDDFRGPFEIVDGKQRLTAVRQFLRGKIPAFGRFYPTDFSDKIPSDVTFFFSINDLKNRKEVLKWYLEMNEGGTPHTPEEINKVKNLIEVQEKK